MLKIILLFKLTNLYSIFVLYFKNRRLVNRHLARDMFRLSAVRPLEIIANRKNIIFFKPTWVSIVFFYGNET
jgi:hypothetical protein